MKKKKPPEDQGSLRQRAEARLRAQGPARATAGLDDEARRLVHELGVHQVELEMQNEELRGARLELEDSLRRYTDLFDFAPIGYVSLATDGVILELNHAAASLFELERSKLVGLPLDDLTFPPDRPSLRRLIGLARDMDHPTAAELRFVRRGGPPVLVRVTATSLEARPPRLMVALEDVSDQRAKEAELARSEATLRETDRRKDEFLAVLSHELRNPLAPIRNSVFVLSRAAAGGEQARSALGNIDRQVTHLTRLIDDLLDVTRISRGKIRLQTQRLELGDLVRRTMDDHRHAFEKSGIDVEGRFGSELFWVEADPARVVQAVSNVLANAEKFTPRGGRVTVSLRRDGGRAALRVADTGIGIAPELRPHVFEPFTQAPQAIDRTRGGLGLGLAMVKGLVELHQGSVHIFSEGPGHGTQLTIWLPLAAPPAAAEAPVEHGRGPARRILVIEDNLDSAESLRDVLAITGHTVELAFDGPSGIELAGRFGPEIVICDIGLPGMDGYAVARAFRADPALRGAYLIALSGYALPEDLERSNEAGFDQHIAKPPGLDDLERLLADMPGAATSAAGPPG